jgi:hypothetical protein
MMMWVQLLSEPVRGTYKQRNCARHLLDAEGGHARDTYPHTAIRSSDFFQPGERSKGKGKRMRKKMRSELKLLNSDVL